MSMDERTRVEYAIRFDATNEIEPLGTRTPRQVKRQLEGLAGGHAGNITVLARGVVELTGDWVPVTVDEQLHPAIPSWESLGFLLGGHERDQRTVPTHEDMELPEPLIGDEAKPKVPVQQVASKRVKPAPQTPAT